MMDTSRFKALLLERRRALTGVEESSELAAAAVELDQTRQGRLSRMDALQQQAMSQEALRRHRVELENIDDALRRIDAGEYGACADCGDGIAAARLEIDPAAALCVRCAARRESQT